MSCENCKPGFTGKLFGVCGQCYAIIRGCDLKCIFDNADKHECAVILGVKVLV